MDIKKYKKRFPEMKQKWNLGNRTGIQGSVIQHIQHGTHSH